MPTNSADQQITTPVDGDPADAPVAFIDFLADVESRLVKRYTNLADRVSRDTSPQTNEVTALGTEGRLDIYDGSNHVSLWRRSGTGFFRRTTDATAIVSNTTLQNDSVLVAPLVANATYIFKSIIYYDSSTTADFRLAFTGPAGSTGIWGATAIGQPGATDMVANTNPIGSTLFMGATGVGLTLIAIINGDISTAGTAGNLDTLYAQSTSDPTNTIVRARSYLWIARIA
jgi:hypothetical protein